MKQPFFAKTNMLQTKGVYRCDPMRIDPDFADAYDWLVRKWLDIKGKMGTGCFLGAEERANTKSPIFQDCT